MKLGSTSVIIILGVVVAYIILTGYLSVRWSGKTNDDFMTGSRGLPTFIIGVLLMSQFIGAVTLVGTAQTAFSSGVAAMWSVIAATIGFIIYGLFIVKKLYGTGGFTISGILENKFGPSTKYIVSIIMIYALFLTNVANYISGASILSTILNMNLNVAMIVVGIVGTFYFCIGGMKSVAYVTAIHTFVKYLGLVITLAVALFLTKGLGPVMHGLPHYYFTGAGKIGWGTIIGWIITSTGSIFSTQYILQSVSSSKNAKSAQKATFLAAGITLPLAFILALIGVCARYLFPKINSLYALSVFIGHMNIGLATIVATGLLAAVFIAVSALSLGAVSLIVQDFYVPHWKPEPKQQLRVTRIISVVVGLLPIVFASITPQVLSMSFFTKAVRVSIAIVAVVAFYLPHFTDTRGANISLVGTAIISTVWFVMGDPFGINDVFVALLTPLIIMTIYKLVMKLAHKTVSCESASVDAQPIEHNKA
ncbi:sodium:solute symporter family protein [Companilactobacillus insicii]|uniref:sodium:solute symporter family protein n=1 Tax=Companilactobacillus insicii TaxID=1732567 RepID=UPI000F792391|nr:sodium:solute symporter family protein [Companilactobacillus insicii]